MAIESSTSPLSAASTLDNELIEKVDPTDAPLDNEERDEEIEQRTPTERKETSENRRENLILQIDDINLARYMTDDDLDRIGMMVVEEYRIDETSRADWLDKSEKAMRFAMQETQPKEFPWPGASSVIFPLITQATIDFAARTYPAIVQGRNVVKGVVWGDDKGTPMTMTGEEDGAPMMSDAGSGQQQPVWQVAPGAKRQRADRIAEHMSWQLLEQMPEWEPQTDQMLHQIPVIGGAGRKTYYDAVAERPKSLFVSLLNLVWNYHAPSFEIAPRITEKVLLYPNQIIDLERGYMGDEDGEEEGGMFLPYNYGPAGGGEGERFNGKDIYSGDSADEQAPHLFIEQHRTLDLDGDGYPEPYIVTVHLRSGKVVRIVARYSEDGIRASKDGDTIYTIKSDDMYTLYRFLPSIDGGSYPMGFGHLLRPLNHAINTSLNQMFDAGTLANTGGGFISDQLGMPSGQTLFGTGKFHRVTTKGMDIRNAVYPIDFKGPSTVLFQLLGTLMEAAKEMAGIGNILAGDAAIANAPPTTVLALIEQGMTFYTAIVKRIFWGEKEEFDKLYAINRRTVISKVAFKRGDQDMEIMPEDYRLGGGVAPVADPTMVTNMQKLGRAQIVVGTMENPEVNRTEALRRLYDAAMIERPDDLINPPDPNADAARQLAMANAQAELGATRAKELKDQTQAFLNMAMARKNADAKEMGFIDQQLTYLRLNIEAMNAATNAHTLSHTALATGMAHAREVAGMALDHHNQGLDRAHETALAQQTPAPGATGSFPASPDVPPGPAIDSPTSPQSDPAAAAPALPGGM